VFETDSNDSNDDIVAMNSAGSIERASSEESNVDSKEREPHQGANMFFQQK